MLLKGPTKSLKLPCEAMTVSEKKSFDLFAQKEFQKKLSMWEYLQIEIYRFWYFFPIETKIFPLNFRSVIVVSKILCNIFVFVSIFVTRLHWKCDLLCTKTPPIDNFEVEHDCSDQLRSFSRCFDRQSHWKPENGENPCQLWAGHL